MILSLRPPSFSFTKPQQATSSKAAVRRSSSTAAVRRSSSSKAAVRCSSSSKAQQYDAAVRRSCKAQQQPQGSSKVQQQQQGSSKVQQQQEGGTAERATGGARNWRQWSEQESCAWLLQQQAAEGSCCSCTTARAGDRLSYITSSSCAAPRESSTYSSSLGKRNVWSADHTQWDNAPAAAQDGQKRNYVICFSESSSSNGSGRVLQQQTPPDMMPLAARVADQELAACCSSDGSSSSSAGLRGSSRSSCCANGEPASLQKKNTAAADSSRSAGLPSHGSGEGGGSSNSSSKSSSGNSSNRAASKPWRQCLRRIVCALVDGHIAAVEGPRCLLITDLDGTLIGNAAYVSQFLLHWKLRHLWRGSKLVYNTGRNLKDFLFAAGGNALLRPDYAILGVGTEVYEFSTEDKQNSSNSRPLEEWLLDDQERQQFKDDIAFCSPQWPTWCPTRRHAHLSSRWLERLRCSTFDRRDLARAAAENLPGCFVNGNIFYDPFRISLSVPASLMAAAQQQQHMEEQQHEEKQQEEDNSSACDGRSDAEERQRAVKYLLRLLKSPHMKTCVSGQGDWRFLDLLPLDGTPAHAAAAGITDIQTAKTLPPQQEEETRLLLLL